MVSDPLPPPPDARPHGVFVGLTTLDIVHRVSTSPGSNEKVTANWQGAAAGGPAANAAVVFAALGGRATLLTGIGGGPIAELIRKDLETQGVDIVDLAPPENEPAISAVTVLAGTGERSVVSMDAGNQRLDLAADVTGIVPSADVVLVDGHHPQLSLAASRAATDRRVPVIVDAGRWKPVMADLLPSSSVAICSADFRTPGAVTSLQTAREILRTGIPQVAVTRGPQPVLWWSNQNAGEVHMPAVEAIDTLGAGDVFHGAFAWYFTQPAREFPDLLLSAGRVAALRCAHLGPREWLKFL